MNSNTDFLADMFSETAAPTPPADHSILPDHSTEFSDPLEGTGDPIETPPEATTEVVTEEVNEPDDMVVGYVEFLKQNDLIEIPEDLEFTGNAEELQKIFEYTKHNRELKAVDKLFEALPEDFKPLLDYALKGGNSIKDFLDVYGQDPLESIDLNRVEDQKKVIFQHYKATSNYTDEKINRLVNLITDETDLRIEAEDSLNALNEIREQQKIDLIKKAEEDRIETQRRLEEQTLNLAKAVETTTLIHPQRKAKVRSFFFDPINVGNQTTTGFNHTIQSILSNPEHQAQLADILLEYDSNSGFSTERLEKRAKTKAAQSFQALLNKTLDPKQAQRASTSKTPTSTSFDWETYSKY